MELPHRCPVTAVSRLFAPTATAELKGTMLFSAAISARSQDAKVPTYGVLFTFTGGTEWALPGADSGSAPWHWIARAICMALLQSFGGPVKMGLHTSGAGHVRFQVA